jgi:glucokinase
MSVIGISLSGTNLKIGRVVNHTLEKIVSSTIDKNTEKFQILDQICDNIQQVISKEITGIGFGVNSVVDLEKGIVFNVKHFPSWNRIHLKDHLEKQFKIPVILNNVCNCFALGEKHFGKTKKYKNSVGLIIGTGVGSGLIINNKLFSGNNCMAGEFGKIAYLKNDIEYYCSENYFRNIYGKSVDEFFEKALAGDSDAMEHFDEYGKHIGNAIKTILYSIDPDIIVLGGSMSKYFDLFKDRMWEIIREFVFPHSLKNLKIEVSEVENITVLGAAALLYDADS